ncbi:MAG: undecaprenyl-diphosphate phosphatase [Bacteroidales bacterium]|nr:undecaprenyl-diphosphate phosphatase [Bacteroidales bacterium]MBN2698359.1 undecaprenyl-diphosphate phosphatase [Bacteroidales bacterium]
MTWFEAFVLGIIQGLTEFLPVSSSGHLEIGKALLNVEIKEDLTFTIIVHFATVLSTITVFFGEIRELISGLFQFRWNEPTRYVAKLLVSMIPVLFVGVFLSEEVESLFSGNLVLVGIALLITASLLTLAYFMKPGGKKRIPFGDALIMGFAQAIAVIPGISRSGATISTGLLLRNDRAGVARFSFLMVLLPIIGAALLDIMSWRAQPAAGSVGFLPILVGFLTAYVSGFIACKWMINIVKKGKLIWFAVYCAIIGSLAIILT